MLLVKVFLILTFLFVFYQDYKTRLVYWFLYPLIGILAFIVQTYFNNFSVMLVNSLFNMLLLATVMIVGAIHSKMIMKRDFINGSIGIGDLLLFLFLCFTFSTITFTILFSFSLLFSLILHFILNHKNKDATVPLAGYMSLFFATVYLTSFFINPAYLYSY